PPVADENLTKATSEAQEASVPEGADPAPEAAPQETQESAAAQGDANEPDDNALGAETAERNAASAEAGANIAADTDAEDSVAEDSDAVDTDGAEASSGDVGTGGDQATDTNAEHTATADASAEDAKDPEVEVFYTFTWARMPRGGGAQNRRSGDKNRSKSRAHPKGKKGSPKADKQRGGQKFSARPPKSQKAIDPDNPFAAALMGLKDDK
ncbi:MAG: hypothetical protein AAGF27_12080, partial [Pseudomonadota bacterium]